MLWMCISLWCQSQSFFYDAEEPGFRRMHVQRVCRCWEGTQCNDFISVINNNAYVSYVVVLSEWMVLSIAKTSLVYKEKTNNSPMTGKRRCHKQRQLIV